MWPLMSDRRLVEQAIAELTKNLEQYEAVHEKGHCVVLAGPGSGKTKTLTTAMARALLEDVAEPRGIAPRPRDQSASLFKLRRRGPRR